MDGPELQGAHCLGGSPVEEFILASFRNIKNTSLDSNLNKIFLEHKFKIHSMHTKQHRNFFISDSDFAPEYLISHPMWYKFAECSRTIRLTGYPEMMLKMT